MKKILLTQDKVTWVDDEDYDAVSRYKWYYAAGNACRRIHPGNKKCHEYLHKRLLPDEGHLSAMHKDGDKLNNCRSNLILAPRKMRQQRVKARSKSGYRGVTLYKDRFVAQICIDGKTIHLGRYATALEAAKAYDDAAVRFYGEAAHLNLPEGYT